MKALARFLELASVALMSSFYVTLIVCGIVFWIDDRDIASKVLPLTLILFIIGIAFSGIADDINSRLDYDKERL